MTEWRMLVPRVAPIRWSYKLMMVAGALMLGFSFQAWTHPVSPQGAKTPPVRRESSANLDPETLLASMKQVKISSRPHVALKPPSYGHLYRIVWGDTLSALASRFHVTVSELEEANKLPDDAIYAGNHLIIPETYQVKAGDSLGSIARQFDVPLLLLWHQNRLVSDKLHPGETLILPYTDPLPKARYDAPPITKPHSVTASSPPAVAAAPTLSSRGSASLGDFTPAEVLSLAHLVQAEAGDQPFVGQVAVAAVVLNRLKTPGFPKTLPGVIFAPGQFETVSNGSYWQSPKPLSFIAAKAAMKGWDPTGGALYFFNPNMSHSGWMATLPETATIGDQVFAR